MMKESISYARVPEEILSSSSRKERYSLIQVFKP